MMFILISLLNYNHLYKKIQQLIKAINYEIE